MRQFKQGQPDPERAKWWASAAHAGQLYEENLPYDFHLDKVVQTATAFGLTDSVFLCACRLHDVMEDTRKSYNDVMRDFGEEVAEMVYAVTDERGRNRKERHEKTYPKTRAHGRAVALKLCDRIANVQHGLVNDGKVAMYAEEFDGFFQALFRGLPPKGSLSHIANEHELETERRLWLFLAQLLGRRQDAVNWMEARGG